METLAFTHVAVEYEDPSPAPELRSFDDLKLSVPTSALIGVVSLGVIAATLSHTEMAQATMTYGDRGSGVTRLQQELGISADGIYGPATSAAVQNFQRRNGLVVDGIAGPATLSALGLPQTLVASGATSGGETPTAGSIYVKASTLNVRSSPSVNAPVRYVLYRGDRVSLSGATRVSDGYEWSQLAGGGWVASLYLSGSGSGTIGSGNGDGGTVVPVSGSARVAAASGLNVRRSPGGDVVGYVVNGTRLSLSGAERYTSGRTWVQLVGGGWVARDYLAFN